MRRRCAGHVAGLCGMSGELRCPEPGSTQVARASPLADLAVVLHQVAPLRGTGPGLSAGSALGGIPGVRSIKPLGYCLSCWGPSGVCEEDGGGARAAQAGHGTKLTVWETSTRARAWRLRCHLMRPRARRRPQPGPRQSQASEATCPMILEPAPRAIALGVGAVPARRCLCLVRHPLILRASRRPSPLPSSS